PRWLIMGRLSSRATAGGMGTGPGILSCSGLSILSEPPPPMGTRICPARLPARPSGVRGRLGVDPRHHGPQLPSHLLRQVLSLPTADRVEARPLRLVFQNQI